MKHGKGKWRRFKQEQGCNKYEGNYEYDIKHGFGIFYWKSGNVYKGEY